MLPTEHEPCLRLIETCFAHRGWGAPFPFNDAAGWRI